jgi:rhodanese-related sulfurtransferase
MRKFSYLVLILALVLSFAIPLVTFAEGDPVADALTAYNENLPAAYGNVSVADLSVEMIDNPDLLLVDVRSPDEYTEGHLEGAINIPLRELAQHLDMLPDLDEEMVVYCGSGWRSALGMTSLQILGYTDVRSMGGGINAWNAEEFFTTTDEFTVEAGTAPDVAPELVKAVDAQLSALPSNWGGVKAEDLNVELIDNPPDFIIDVRKTNEWAANGYISGAVLMPLQELMSFTTDLPADLDANIVVYCKAGHRGNMAATMLRTLGYTNVRNLSGGFLAWAGADLPVDMAE